MVDLQLEHLGKTYPGSPPVLADISLNVAAGELFFLLGPSGCGKSTLLRIVAGFLAPDTGTVRFGGEDVTAMPAEKRQAGMVFQSYALWPHMTVYQNVAFGLDVRAVDGVEKDRRVREALAMVGLESLADRKSAALSGGQQQRVALARAIVIRPRVLLLDEPLSNLDAKLRIQMRTEIRRICKDAELTGIYVTHDQKEALTMADRIAILQGGVLQQVGTPRDVYARPANRFVAGFIGEANFLPGTAVGGGVETAIGVLRSTAEVAAGAAVTVMIRPENLRIAAPGAANSFTATVTGGEFLGETGSWTLRAGEADLQFFELRPQPRDPGQQVHLAVDPADVVVLQE